jgi:cyclopropane-fatty-acyl-phospholipid synthase
MLSSLNRDANINNFITSKKQNQPQILNWRMALVWRVLKQIKHGHLIIHWQGHAYHFGQASPHHPSVNIALHDLKALSAIVNRGSIGAAEGYIHGWWDTHTLTELVQLFVRNQSALNGLSTGWLAWTRPALKLLNQLKRNSQTGAKRNIAAHYDLSNDFFAQFLDASMMYSSAVYAHPQMCLVDASEYKIEQACQWLQLSSTDHLLEIGSGWGSMALYAAQKYGCRVTTITLSQQQYDFVVARIHSMGLSDRVDIQLQDYRNMSGQYDKIVSIEMIEAVGHEYLTTYFQQCNQLLKPKGLMLLQSITIADQRAAFSRRHVDFIQSHIFPGGALPSPTQLQTHIGNTQQLRVIRQRDIGQDYARTLFDWRQKFEQKLPTIMALGFDENFIRMWRYYLCYCEGGFLENQIHCLQLLIAGEAYRPSCLH